MNLRLSIVGFRILRRFHRVDRTRPRRKPRLKRIPTTSFQRRSLCGVREDANRCFVANSFHFRTLQRSWCLVSLYVRAFISVCHRSVTRLKLDVPETTLIVRIAISIVCTLVLYVVLLVPFLSTARGFEGRENCPCSFRL